MLYAGNLTKLVPFSADSSMNMPGRKWLRRQHVLFSVRTLVSQEKRLSRRISIFSIRSTLLPGLENKLAEGDL
jgi:hypothetical protein